MIEYPITLVVRWLPIDTIGCITATAWRDPVEDWRSVRVIIVHVYNNPLHDLYIQSLSNFKFLKY